MPYIEEAFPAATKRTSAGGASARFYKELEWAGEVKSVWVQMTTSNLGSAFEAKLDLEWNVNGNIYGGSQALIAVQTTANTFFGSSASAFGPRARLVLTISSTGGATDTHGDVLVWVGGKIWT